MTARARQRWADAWRTARELHSMTHGTECWQDMGIGCACGCGLAEAWEDAHEDPMVEAATTLLWLRDDPGPREGEYLLRQDARRRAWWWDTIPETGDRP